MTELARLVLGSSNLWESWNEWMARDVSEHGHSEEYDLALDRLPAVARMDGSKLDAMCQTHCEGIEEVLDPLRPTADREIDSDEWFDRAARPDGDGDRFGLDWIAESSWRIAIFLHAMRRWDRTMADEAVSSVHDAVGG